eukprot:5185627-Amphidinium_carterae.1
MHPLTPFFFGRAPGAQRPNSTQPKKSKVECKCLTQGDRRHAQLSMTTTTDLAAVAHWPCSFAGLMYQEISSCDCKCLAH